MDNDAALAKLRALSAMSSAAPVLYATESLPFFGDDWDDVLEGMPTVRKPSAPAGPANDTRRSGVWRRRAASEPSLALPLPRAPMAEEPFPLLARWVDPADILEELHADPWRAIEPGSAPTLEVLPWDIEVLENTLELRASLMPPSLLPPMPVFAVTTPRRGLLATLRLWLASAFAR